MRYVGQGHEIAVPLPARPLDAADAPAIRAAYDAEYARFYDRPVPGSDVEVMSYAVTVATLPPTPQPPRRPSRPPGAPNPPRTQRVRDTATGAVADWAIYDRASLAPGRHASPGRRSSPRPRPPPWSAPAGGAASRRRATSN